MSNDNPNQKTGRIMLVMAFILGLLMLTEFFNNVLEGERNPNQQVQSVRNGEAVEVVLQRNRYGHYVATGTINGEPVEFLVDTGATDVAVSDKIATRLNLKRGYESQVMTANGITTAYDTTLDRVTLGEIQQHNVRASIVPGLDDETILLGMTFLGELELVQKNDLLMLRQ